VILGAGRFATQIEPCGEQQPGSVVGIDPRLVEHGFDARVGVRLLEVERTDQHRQRKLGDLAAQPSLIHRQRRRVQLEIWRDRERWYAHVGLCLRIDRVHHQVDAEFGKLDRVSASRTETGRIGMQYASMRAARQHLKDHPAVEVPAPQDDVPVIGQSGQTCIRGDDEVTGKNSVVFAHRDGSLLVATIFARLVSEPSRASPMAILDSGKALTNRLDLPAYRFFSHFVVSARRVPAAPLSPL
jgi:hypothetical protein